MVHPSQLKDCNMCNKQPGLPFFFVRAAPATQATNAPRFGDSFKAEPHIPLGENTWYTPRMLRPGHLYLYNPANKHDPWQGYVVTQDSHYYPFRIGRHGPERVLGRAGEVTPCKPDEYGAIAQAVVIPHAEKAEDIWVTYSDVEWTQAVWQRFNDNVDGCRDKVMRKFNVKNWLASPQHEHAVLLKDMAGKIAEFSDAVQPKEFSFSSDPLQRRTWSLQDWGEIARALGMPPPADPMHPTTEEAGAITKKLAGLKTSEQNDLFKKAKFGTWDILVAKFNRLCEGSPATAEKGLVLALDDVVGITSDVAALVGQSNRKFAEKLIKEDKDGPKSLYRKLMADQAITGVRSMVCDTAVRGRMETKDLMKTGLARGARASGMLAVPFLLSLPFLGEALSLSEEEYKTLSEDAWKEYAPFVNAGEIQAFRQEYADKLASFNESEVVSLSKAHSQWLLSSTLAETMRCHYDEANIYSGLAYASAISLCLGPGQEFAEVRRVIEKWVHGEVTDPRNLYLRALTLNQDATATEVSKLIGNINGNINGKSFYQQMPFWQEFLDNGFTLIEESLKRDDSVIQLLLAQASGVIMEAIQETTRTANAAASQMAHWSAILGGLSGKAVSFVRGCGSPKGLLNFVGNRIYDSLHSTKSSKVFVLHTIFQRDMFGEVHMRPVEGTAVAETNLMVMIDKAQIKPGMSEAEASNLLGKQTIKGEAASSSKRALYDVDRNLFAQPGNVAVAGSLIGFFFNLAAAGAALTTYREGGKRHPEIASEFEKNELAARLGAGILGCVASFSEAISAVMVRTIPPARLAHGFGLKMNVFLKVVGMGLGAFASGIVAYRDAVGFKEAYDKDKGAGLIFASFASFIISGATFGLAMYSFVSYLIMVLKGARTTAAIAEVSSITVAGLEIPIVNALIVLFVVGLLACNWRDKQESKEKLREWLSRSVFGDGRKGAMYSSLEIELSALNVATSR